MVQARPPTLSRTVEVLALTCYATARSGSTTSHASVTTGLENALIVGPTSYTCRTVERQKMPIVSKSIRLTTLNETVLPERSSIRTGASTTFV